MSHTTQTDNSALESKLGLRRYFLGKYHGVAAARVLDCCGGRERIWGRLRDEFEIADYLSLDMKRREGRLRLDSRRFLRQRGLEFDVIDIDTYGSPWKHWKAMLEFWTGTRTVFLTWGAVGAIAADSMVLEALGIGFGCFRTLNTFAGLRELALPYFLDWAVEWGWRLVEVREAPRGKNARYLGINMEKETRKGDPS